MICRVQRRINPVAKLGEGLLVGIEFEQVVPDCTFLPLAVEDIRMRERLFEAFKPGIAACIQPDLHCDRAVLEQEGKGRGDGHRSSGRVPARNAGIARIPDPDSTAWTNSLAIS